MLARLLGGQAQGPPEERRQRRERHERRQAQLEAMTAAYDRPGQPACDVCRANQVRLVAQPCRCELCQACGLGAADRMSCARCEAPLRGLRRYQLPVLDEATIREVATSFVSCNEPQYALRPSDDCPAACPRTVSLSPCMHRFCGHCLAWHLRQQLHRYAGHRRMPAVHCPTCGREVWSISSMTKEMSSFPAAEMAIPCASCGSHESVAVFDCGHALCIPCACGIERRCRELHTEPTCPLCRRYLDNPRPIWRPVVSQAAESIGYV